MGLIKFNLMLSFIFLNKINFPLSREFEENIYLIQINIFIQKLFNENYENLFSIIFSSII